MRYIVNACRGYARRAVPAQSEAAALDVIGELVTAGFQLETVVEEGGKEIGAMTLVDRLETSTRKPARRGY